MKSLGNLGWCWTPPEHLCDNLYLITDKGVDVPHVWELPLAKDVGQIQLQCVGQVLKAEAVYKPLWP